VPHRSSSLVYWSNREQRWKPVPPPSAAALRAAQSAAAEVVNSVSNELAPPANSGRETSTSPLPANSVKARRSYNTAVLAELHRLQGTAGSSGTPGNNETAPDRPISQPWTAAGPMEIDKAVEQAAARHHVDPNLVRAIIKVESNFNSRAVSRKGAMGLMQLMPDTARRLNVNNPFDPRENVDAGVRHLRTLLDNYGGDLKLSLAAYNAGETAVARSNGVPKIAETQNYVKQITRSYLGGTFSEGSRLELSSQGAPLRVFRRADGVLTITNE